VACTQTGPPGGSNRLGVESDIFSIAALVIKKTKLMLCWCGDSQGVPHQVAGAADRHQHQEVVSARAEP